MTNTKFLEVLKDFINENRKTIKGFEDSGNLDQVDIDKMNDLKGVFDKLEQDYFHLPADMSFENIKEFDEDGNLKKTTTEQVEEGLLKIFNALVENGEYDVGRYDFDNEKYSTSLCQIADRLLQIESIEKFR